MLFKDEVVDKKFIGIVHFYRWYRQIVFVPVQSRYLSPERLPAPANAVIGKLSVTGRRGKFLPAMHPGVVVKTGGVGACYGMVVALRDPCSFGFVLF